MTSCAFNGERNAHAHSTNESELILLLPDKVQAGQGRCRVNTFISQKTREKESNIQGSLLSKSSNVTFHHMGAPHRAVLEYTQPLQVQSETLFNRPHLKPASSLLCTIGREIETRGRRPLRRLF